MSYVDDLLARARDAFEKAKVVDDFSAKESYLFNAYHLAMNAREHGSYDAEILMRTIKTYAELNGIYVV